MADNGHDNSMITAEIMTAPTCLSEKMLRMQQIATAAVQKAQEENRRLGLPNWYSINGHIVSDIEIAAIATQREAASNGKSEIAVHSVAAD